MRVVFRADASYDLGTGHVMRCLILAKGLQDRGNRCSFICRGMPGNLIEKIKNDGIEVAELGGWRNYGQLDPASDPIGGTFLRNYYASPEFEVREIGWATEFHSSLLGK